MRALRVDARVTAPTRLLSVAVAGVVAMSVAGCGDVDSKRVAEEITVGLKSQRDVEAQVSCPSDEAAEEGATFTCTARADGQTVDVEVRQLDDDGKVEWRVGPSTGTITP